MWAISVRRVGPGGSYGNNLCLCMGKHSGQINLDYEPLAECIYVALAIIIYIPLFLDA